MHVLLVLVYVIIKKAWDKQSQKIFFTFYTHELFLKVFYMNYVMMKYLT